MQVVLRYQKPGQTSATEVVAWRDPNPIQRGHAYYINVQVNFDPNGNGYLNVWRDGAQIVKYEGAIGMAGASYNWQEGIYRSHTASETMAADYSNLHITTGSAAALASQSFALLNQQLASNSGGLGSGQIATTVSQAAGSGQQTLLTTPQH